MKSLTTGYKPHKYQKEIHANLRRFSVVVCHRRFGKTYLAINTLIHDALLHDPSEENEEGKKSAGRYAYIAPFLKQSKQIAWDYLKQFTSHIPNCKISESELFVELPNGSRIRLYGADNADSMRGIYLHGVVIDEMGDFKAGVYEEVIRPTLSDYEGWALFIGTPKGMNKFYEMHLQAQKNPDWYSGVFRADETDIIKPSELEEMKSTLSPNAYRQELLCDFTASTDDTLIDIDTVSRATAVTVREETLSYQPKIIGVDIARFGDDRSVIIKRHGHAVLKPKILKKADNMHVCGIVAQEIIDFEPDAIFIDAGRGEGVIDRLRQLGVSPIEINFGGKPANPRYANKKAEMWDTMKKWLESGGALPNHAALKTDLCIPTYHFDAHNRMALESKDQIKKRGLKSPDIADALALTFAMPVVPDSMRRASRFYRNGSPVIYSETSNNPFEDKSDDVW